MARLVAGRLHAGVNEKIDRVAGDDLADLFQGAEAPGPVPPGSAVGALPAIQPTTE